MSTWLKSPEESWYHRLIIQILKYGPIPRHVAFIMDGNRRFAKKMEKQTIQGHISGFDQLAYILGWCHKLGIQEVTVYAFSIENFKRSESEVSQLMNLSREKFDLLLEEKDKMMEKGVRIRVIGDTTLLDGDLQQKISRVMHETKNNQGCTLNVAMAYTSREEICSTCNEVQAALSAGDLSSSDVNSELFSRALYTQDSPAVDLLVRTSGETRLSDFMLWQSAFAYLHFESVFWPEYSIWHLYKALILYQRAFPQLQAALQHARDSAPLSPHADKFLQHLYRRREAKLSIERLGQ